MGGAPSTPLGRCYLAITQLIRKAYVLLVLVFSGGLETCLAHSESEPAQASISRQKPFCKKDQPFQPVWPIMVSGILCHPFTGKHYWESSIWNRQLIRSSLSLLFLLMSFNLAISFLHFWLCQISQWWRENLGRARSQGGPGMMIEGVTLSSPCPQITIMTSRWGHGLYLKALERALQFIWSDTGVAGSPAEGICFPFCGNLVGLRGPKGFCRTFLSLKSRTPPWVLSPFRSVFCPTLASLFRLTAWSCECASCKPRLHSGLYWLKWLFRLLLITWS